MSSDDKIDMECFIMAVRDRPPLWDPAYGQTNDIKASHPLWEEVCHEVFPKYDKYSEKKKRDIEFMLQTKWKNLKLEYVQELKRVHQPGGSSRDQQHGEFPYFQLLNFLFSALSHDQYVQALSGVKNNARNANKRKLSHIADNEYPISELAEVYYRNIYRYSEALGINEEDREEEMDLLLSILPFLKDIPKKYKPPMAEELFNLVQERAKEAKKSCLPSSSRHNAPSTSSASDEGCSFDPEPSTSRDPEPGFRRRPRPGPSGKPGPSYKADSNNQDGGPSSSKEAGSSGVYQSSASLRV